MNKVEPLCPVFGICGGCEYQDLSYEDELCVKEAGLKELFQMELSVGGSLFEPILSSPKPYHYRHRLDLSLHKTRQGTLIGLYNKEGKQVVDINACPIADEKVSDFIPQLKEQALEKLPSEYRTANLTVKTSDDERVHWGGIGRRSLHQKEEDYLWVELCGKKIYFSLETFFQANLSILPSVVEKIRALPIWNKEASFYDLYSGVGLFGLLLADQVKKVVMIEESPHSDTLAQYNIEQHACDYVTTHCGETEKLFEEFISKEAEKNAVVMVDPPRKGLQEKARLILSEYHSKISSLIYLSCHPESLMNDLKELIASGWRVQRVMPLDFFPKTVHLETLVWLK